MAFKIGELARRVDVNPKTIRYYEELGLITSDRAPNNYRLYNSQAETTLTFIKSAKKLGLSLHEIQTIFGDVEQGYCQNAKKQISELLQSKISEVDTQIAELARVKSFLVKRLINIENTDQNSVNSDCSCLGENTN